MRYNTKQFPVLSSYIPQGTGTERKASNKLRDDVKSNFCQCPVLVDEDSHADVEEDTFTSQIAPVHMTLGRENKQRCFEAASSTPVG